MKTIKPLLVTPSAMPGESLAGLILRTSERNGFTSPNEILKMIGTTEAEVRSVRPPYQKLSQLFARPVTEFSAMGYSARIPAKRRKQWRIGQHSVSTRYLSTTSAKICPECILELGYVESFWELRHAIACPKHQRKAITHCPACKVTLKWVRPGMLKCRCGQDLSEAKGDMVGDHDLLNMMALIKAKIDGHKLDQVALVNRGFPLRQLNSISLETLLGIVHRFGLKMMLNRGTQLPPGQTDETFALKEAAKVFDQWPNGFFDYLESIPDTKKKVESFNLQRQFHSFIYTLFKTGLPESEISFLKKAFVAFGNQRWKTKGFIDIRLVNSAEENRTVVGISGLAKYLNVQPPTVMSYVRKGLIKGEKLTTGKLTRRIFDLEKDVPFKPAEGRYYKIREAALFLGISLNLLRELKQKDIYRIVRLGWGIGGYSELDLIDFRNRLLQAVHKHGAFDPVIHIKLGKILNKKRLDVSFTAEIIGELLEGTLQPQGQDGAHFRDIILLRSDIDSRLALAKYRIMNDRIHLTA
jgi:hypothetical protein